MALAQRTIGRRGGRVARGKIVTPARRSNCRAGSPDPAVARIFGGVRRPRPTFSLHVNHLPLFRLPPPAPPPPGGPLIPRVGWPEYTGRLIQKSASRNSGVARKLLRS